MPNETFVQFPQSSVVLCHGQIGNIRQHLAAAKDHLDKKMYSQAENALEEARLELAYLEQYLPPHQLKFPF